MQQIESKTDYGEIVQALVNEFEDEIRDGAGRAVANAVTGTFDIVAGGRPVVLSGVEYEGGPVDCLEEALNPYDVLRYTDVEVLPDPDDPTGGYVDPAAGRAAEVLTIDMLRAVDNADEKQIQPSQSD